MILKSVEVQGFKSFPDKTKVNFNKGLTAVVGPNGSGKSNISDAVRWVMGEQSTKNLRGAKMEDVIFTGTKSRKSQGFAQVSLTIDNTDRGLALDSDEVIITRRYDRSGDSEYKINSKTVRLKDLNELFMDTGLGRDGYAMVGQGKIAEIVQAKSDQRREIFEEAAGISKYRYRKNEAERKLNLAEENLLRLCDILVELEERVEPLKVQSEKAKQFLELSEEKKKTEIAIWLNTLERTNRLLKDNSDGMLASKMEHDKFDAQIEKIENEISAIYEQMQESLVFVDKMQEEKNNLANDNGEFSSQIAVCENTISHNENSKLEISAQNEEFLKDKNEIIASINEKVALIKALEVKLESTDEKSRDNKRLYDELLVQDEKNKLQLTTLIDEQNKISLKKSQNSMMLAQLENQIQSDKLRAVDDDNLFKTKLNTIAFNKGELNSASELIEVLEEKVSGLKNSKAGYELKVRSRNEKIEEIKNSLDEINQKIRDDEQKIKLLLDLENAMEGYAYSVKSILQMQKNGKLGGIIGTVSQVISVKKEFTVAIETAIGAALQNIVVENEQNAKQAINVLKRDKLGRATFLPLTAIKGYKVDIKQSEDVDGVIGIGSDLVEYDNKFEQVVLSLLGRTIVVDNLDTAVIVAKKNAYKYRVVTLDGQVVNAGGSMTGGSQNKNAHLLSRKSQIDDLQIKVTALKEKSQKIIPEYEDYKAEIAQINSYIQGVNSEIITVNEDKIRCEGEINRITQIIEQDENLLSQMKKQMDEYTSKAKDNEGKILLLKEQIPALSAQEEKSVADIKILRDSISNLEMEKNDLSEKINNGNIENLNIIKDIDANKALIESIKSRGDNQKLIRVQNEEKLLMLAEQNYQHEKQIVSLSEKISAGKAKIIEIEAKIQDKINFRTELEKKATENRSSLKQLNHDRENITRQVAKFEEKAFSLQKEYDIIIQNLWEEYSLTKNEATSFAKEITDVTSEVKILNSLKSKIRALGSINVDAIEEYKEVLERYEFLDKEVKDAQKAKGELIRLINELTEKMMSIFEESFNRINSNFSNIFVELFGGGQAKLILSEPEDILQSGIEIFVEPPGKIIKNLSLLSGGEQAFVAIAIYFSILKVRPAPFCVLDEIEAALDDVNVIKYASYLRKICDKTQFITITHRRGTMEEADMLYGVTMQDEGVSKLIALNVSEIENKLGLKEVT